MNCYGYYFNFTGAVNPPTHDAEMRNHNKRLIWKHKLFMMFCSWKNSGTIFICLLECWHSSFAEPPPWLPGLISTSLCTMREWTWLLYAPSWPPDLLYSTRRQLSPWSPLLPAPAAKPPWLLRVDNLQWIFRNNSCCNKIRGDSG